jgi:hypothetical protein
LTEATLATARPKCGDSGGLGTDIWFVLVVTATSLGVRLLAARFFPTEPVWDGHYYHYGATRIAEGLGYSEDILVHGVSTWKPWTHYPVGCSAYLAVWFRALGNAAWVSALANSCVGAGIVVLGYHLLAVEFGRWRARLGAVVLGLHPGLLLYGTLIMSELLAALLVLGVLALALRQSTLARVLAGVFLGCAILVRPSTLLLAPLLIFVTSGSWGRRLARAGMITGLALVTVLPWTARNCVRMDGCALVSTNMGWNLAISALTEDGRFRTLRASDGCRIGTGQVAQDRCWRDFALSRIREDFWPWLGRAPKKLAQTFDHESFAIEYLRESNPDAWPESRRVRGRELLTAVHRVGLLCALLSLFALPRHFRNLTTVQGLLQAGLLAATLLFGAFLFTDPDQPPFYLLVVVLVSLYWVPMPGAPGRHPLRDALVGFVGLTALTHVIFFGDDRYHMVVTPVLVMLAMGAFRQAPIPRSSS